MISEDNAASKFWPRINKTDGCWIWTGGASGTGHGTFYKGGGVTEYAHRFSWRMKNGDIPDGLCVLHKCDNPPCVRPDHLFLGTKRDNIIDRNRKGRGDAAYARCSLLMRGEKNRFALMTEAQVREVREYKGGMGIRERLRFFAAKFGVGYSTISCVHYRSTWRHI